MSYHMFCFSSHSNKLYTYLSYFTVNTSIFHQELKTWLEVWFCAKTTVLGYFFKNTGIYSVLCIFLVKNHPPRAYRSAEIWSSQFYLAHLSCISSDISPGILSGIFSDIVSGISSGMPFDNLSGFEVATLNTAKAPPSASKMHPRFCRRSTRSSAARMAASHPSS